VTRRTLLYIGLGVGIVVVGALVSSSSTRSSGPSGEPAVSTGSSPTSSGRGPLPFPLPSTTSTPLPLRRPASSVAEFGVLSAKSEEALRALADRGAVAAAVTPDLCGDAAACDAVRATLRDEQATSLRVLDAAAWRLEKLSPRVVVVRVATPTGPKQLALRAAIAGAAAIARKTRGTVSDPLLGRVEPATAFAAHAVTVPLEATAFRRDRVDVLRQPKGEGVVRLLTAGLSRWGAPEVEAAAAPSVSAERVAEVVLAVAEAVANGATTGPLELTRDDLARARGQAYPADAGMPEVKTVEVDVVSVNAQSGDASDLVARIEPPGGDGPLGYVDLAERFFGPLLAAAPGADVLDERRGKAQSQLASALARWDAAKNGGARLLVLLPFPIPGDAGAESMWIEVTRFDARNVSGKVLDDPLGATDVKRGDEVTRPRAQVQDLELREAAP
jgi:hypothetical protein